MSGAIEKERESLRALSTEIWSNPELNYEEVVAHKVLTDYLEDKGFTVDREYCDIKTAFRARCNKNCQTCIKINSKYALGLDQVHLTCVLYANTMLYQKSVMPVVTISLLKQV